MLNEIAAVGFYYHNPRPARLYMCNSIKRLLNWHVDQQRITTMFNETVNLSVGRRPQLL